MPPVLLPSAHIESNIPSSVMILRLTLLLVAGSLLSSCAYPFGHSHNGNYYGGQGAGIAPRQRVPNELQRERSMF